MERIIILQCTDVDNWYKDMTGKEFELSHEFANYYWVKFINKNGNKALNTVNIRDAKKIIN